MKRFYEPERVALIGASGTKTRPGYHLFSNLNASFGDNFFPVNPRVDAIEQKTCYPGVIDIPAEIDAAVVFIASRAVPAALEQCAKKGIQRVIIESGGFAETGPEGQALQKRCLEIARAANMRLWGPNCMGLINVQQKKFLTFMRPEWRERFVPGSVALVVQSGMLSAGFLANILTDVPFGLSRIASIGNKMDVDETEILEYLINDSDTGVIAMYLESLERGRRFFELSRSTEKPIVVFKAGRTEIGAQAAMSHTASLAQNDRVLDSALRQAGIIRAGDFNELIDVARSLGASSASPKSQSRIAVLAFSGGAAVAVSDFIADHGMKIARLGEAAIGKIREVFPEWMEPVNPLDLYPAIEKTGYGRVMNTALEAVLDDPEVDAVYAHVFANFLFEAVDYPKIIEKARQRDKQIVVWVLGDAERVAMARRKLEGMGLPVVKEVSKGVRILAALTARK